MASIDKLRSAEEHFNCLAESILKLDDVKDRKWGVPAVKRHIDTTRIAINRAYEDPTENNIFAAQSMTDLFKSYAQTKGVSGMRLANKDTQKNRAETNEKLARIDSLTQLANKAGTLAATKDMIARSTRDGSSVAVLFVDLTKFKPINDKLGHQQGDEALQLVAEKILKTVRDGDIVGRIGGDEFVIVMSNTEPTHDFLVEKQKLTKLFDGNIVYEDTEHGNYPIGGDIGLAIVAEGETAEAAIKRADHLMYEAKQIRHKELEREETLISSPAPE